jgi:hypothetical protein
MTPKNEFTTFEVVKIVGIKMERLQDWMKRGFIKPTRQVPISRGLKNYFDRLHLYIIKTFHYLVENGLNRQEASLWTRNIHKYVASDIATSESTSELDEPPRNFAGQMPTFIMVLKGDSPFGSGLSIVIIKDDRHMIELNRATKTEAIHIINFSTIINTIDMKINSLGLDK